MAASKGSVEDLHELNLQIGLRAPEDPELQFLLPALYLALDPVGIPTPDQLETMLLAPHTTSFAFIDVITTSFHCLIVIAGIPPEASLDLWPRAWKWFYFIHNHLELFPWASSELSVYIGFILLLGHLQTHEPTVALINATDDVGFVIARAWRAFLAVPELPDLVWRQVSAVIYPPANIQDYLGGVGGPTELAAVVVDHIKQFSHSNSASSVFCLDKGLRFAWDIMFTHDWSTMRRPLTTSLLAHGLVKAVCSALDILTAAMEETMGTIALCINGLKIAFLNPPGYPSIIEALKAGFLSHIVAYVGGLYPHIAVDDVKSLLTLILPPSTIYHSVLTEMKPALMQVATLVTADAFVKSPIFDDWKKFQRVANDRIKVMEYFDSDEYEAALACDNIECGEIFLRNEFHRCSGEVTEKLALPIGHFASPADPVPYSIRDKSFLRELLHHDYKRSKPHIFVAQAMNLLEDMPLCTQFDYTGPLLVVSHHTTNDVAGQESDKVHPAYVQWTDLLYTEPGWTR
ncbi:hypothetical protein DFH07DRAFT_1004099 [Mycena maculata]|uniref:Uncharacterized protein n=1 Tax=Mycena maculata TaxID=230809 RepID=A0AAD7HN94_9AGAR|nr:hypothetical protein DFH07DRAFT_1004099 [Mycena maculata]